MSMRPLVPLLFVAFAASAAGAQTAGPPPPIGGCGQSQQLFFDDGTAESSWKVRNPSGSKDCFNVDFDDMAGDMTVTGIALQTWQTSASGPQGLRFIALCPDNVAVDSTGRTPDLRNPLSHIGRLDGTVPITGNPGPSAGFCPPMVVFDTPDVTVGTTGGAHAVTGFMTGDSSTWLCADSSSFSDSRPRRSHFTSTAYRSPALAMSTNVMARLVGVVPPPAGGSASLTVNNGANDVVFSETDPVVITLWSTASVQPTRYLQGIHFGSGFIPLPGFILFTGFENSSSISDLTQGSICGTAAPPCSLTGPFSFDFLAFYEDNDDLFLGSPIVKVTNLVGCTITPGHVLACNPCVCFGQKDDGFMDGSVWKVGNPSGAAHYFNVRMDNSDSNTRSTCTDVAAGGPVSTITDFEIASWDFCGTGPSWGSIAIYPADLSLDPSGNTPLLGSPIVSATTLRMPPGAADFSYPATIYDCPDTRGSTNSALAASAPIQMAAGWKPGDSCTWMASDDDAIDDDATSTGPCTVAPSTSSYFSLNGFSTPAIPFHVNWMMRINWS